MWSTVVAERLGLIDHDEAVARLDKTLGSLETMERHEPSGQYFNWYDHTTGEGADRLAPDRRHRRADPVVRRQRLAGDRACRSSPNTVPELSQRARSLFESMDFGFYYRPDVNRIAFHVHPEYRGVAVLLRHDREREPDRQLHRDRQRRAAGEGVLRRVADVPRDMRLELARDAAGRLQRDVPRRQRLRGRLPVRGLPRRPRLGRQHVRGAHARRCSFRRSSGARGAGRSTTR